MNWKESEALVLSIPPCLPGSTIWMSNRNTRYRWSTLMSPVRIIRLENPDYQVELDGTGVSCFDSHREPSDSDSRWPSLVPPSNPTTASLTTATDYNEALEASYSISTHPDPWDPSRQAVSSSFLF